MRRGRLRVRSDESRHEADDDMTSADLGLRGRVLDLQPRDSWLITSLIRYFTSFALILKSIS